MQYMAEKLPGVCDVIPCDYMRFPRLLIPEEGLTLKLTSKCFSFKSGKGNIYA